VRLGRVDLGELRGALLVVTAARQFDNVDYPPEQTSELLAAVLGVPLAAVCGWVSGRVVA
jgi:hypothetical protein